jgi:hypothetical protein
MKAEPMRSLFVMTALLNLVPAQAQDIGRCAVTGTYFPISRRFGAALRDVMRRSRNDNASTTRHKVRIARNRK